MNLAWISVGALAAAIALSCFSPINVGVLSIALAWIIGVYLGGMTVKQVAAGFPVDLFLTLAGVTLLFAQAQVNGTLEKISLHAVRLCRGNAALLPLMFFLLAAALASMGPGNIATAALLAPAAMAAAGRTRIPSFLMAIMVGNGANSGSLSPIAPTGIIVNGLMERIGLRDFELTNWWNNFAAHAAVALLGYLLFGGLSLFRRHSVDSIADTEAPPLDKRQWITLATIAGLVIGALFPDKHWHGGLRRRRRPRPSARFRRRRGDPENAMEHVIDGFGSYGTHRNTGKNEGVELFAGLIARISTRESATAVVAFVTGLVSVYSSTSGVVLPAFLPTIPALIQKLGGGDALALASSMNVGGHLVDVSPLSTIGALCIAGVTSYEESRLLFYKLLIWGLSMSIVGALFSYVFFR